MISIENPLLGCQPKQTTMLYEWLIDALLPELCPACREPSRLGFCSTCTARFARVENPCGRCGLPLPVAHCPRASLAHIARVVAPFIYAAPLAAHVQALKYHGARPTGRALALAAVEALRAERERVDALVAVPLHPQRLRARGYNQSVEIARTLARHLRLPLLAAGVRRVAAGESQTRLDANARHASMAAAFAVTRSFTGLGVAIVDDVITTGATANALARALSAAGAARVDAWAVARTL
jgi:ComF family protein